ncbi:MAG TPA: sialidase family protein [Gemmatimonadales bacterium]|nr:sialidase family protein [Gemmatimonadales bacterium]
MRPIHLLGALALAGCTRDHQGGDHAMHAPPVVVSTATDNGATPMFLTAPDGARVVSWVSAPGGGAEGVLNVSVTPMDAAGAEPTVTIRDTLGPIEPHGEAPPQLAADSTGRLYALYAVGKEVPGQRFPVSALRLVRSEDGGRSWSAPVTVNEAGRHGDFGAHNFHALLALPDGRLVATWLLNDRGVSGVAMSRSRDYGRTWEPTRMVYREPTCPCCRTAIAAAPDGSLYLAWRAIFAGDVRDVVVMRSPDGGDTWGAPVKPREDGWVFPGCPHAGPSLKVDAAGAVHIAWWQGKAGEAGVYYARSTDGGRSFAAQPIATAERSSPAHVQLALRRDGRVAVAWDDGHSPLPRVLLRRSVDGGRHFGVAMLLSDDQAAATFPVLAVVGDSLCVAWSQMTEAAHRDKLARTVNMKDPKAVMPLPRVGQSEILMRMVGL